MNEQLQQQSPPPNYLAFAIITTILCCLPFGIISIIFAAQVNSKWAAGDFAGAQSSSKNAKTWAWVAFAIGISGLVIYLLVILFAGVTAFWANGLDM
ncbi:MAG: CD225/dispanin family protein [Draconibacterium sp.]|nr:CD225/dispanin family protein [Draconibacterium sp.]